MLERPHGSHEIQKNLFLDLLPHQGKPVSKRDRGKRSLRNALGPSFGLADYLMLAQPALYYSETLTFFLLLLVSVFESMSL